jgi:hypothetical protein
MKLTLLFASGLILGIFTATLLRYLLDALPLGPHAVVCDAGRVDPAPPSEEWIDGIIERVFVEGKK